MAAPRREADDGEPYPRGNCDANGEGDQGAPFTENRRLAPRWSFGRSGDVAQPRPEARMRGFSKFLAVAAIAAAFIAPPAAAGFNGGGGPPSFGGAGPVLPAPGGDGVEGPHGPSAPNRGPGGVLPPSNPSGPNAGFKPPHGAPPSFAGHGDGDNWHRRPRHYWLGGGPIFVPDLSGDYVYSDDDYDDGGDPTGCWIYRKAYDRAGHFLGFVHVDLCEGQ
jgi:hypothetical protein